MDEEKDTNQYELAALLKSEDDIASVATVVRQHNGEITAEPRAKKLALEYKIKGNLEAVFVTCYFKASGEDAKQLEQDLRTRQGVIRSMVLRATSGGGLPISMPTSALSEQPGHTASAPRAAAAREPRKQPPREPLSNEALENLLREI